MCGIVAVIRRRSVADAPVLELLADGLDDALSRLRATASDDALDVGALAAAAESLAGVDAALRGVPGLRSLLTDRRGFVGLEHRVTMLSAVLAAVEARLDSEALVSDADVERRNAALIDAKDAAWSIGHDRLSAARGIEELAGGVTSRSAVEVFASIQLALSALERLEVRGRDSAGLHVLVVDHGLALDDPAVEQMIASRRDDRLFTSGAVRTPDGHLAFVYKTAAEIGELGDNTARLREQIGRDELLRLALAGDDARAIVLGHTRWASVGIISEANAHPLIHEEVDRADGPYVAAALNGDVDNHADLKALSGLQLDPEVTTDAKVIPALVSRRLDGGDELVEAFRATVATFEGSVAIAAHAAADPDRLLLAQRGSGQALYVGLADDAFVVASEPYGLVEEATRYVRLDGETELDPGDPSTQGQIVAVDARGAGTLEGIGRWSYDGRALPVTATELQTPEMTTRDVDRGEFPHYLLKEISEAPSSFRKTLRGRIVERDDRLTVQLGDDALPEALRARLRAGAITRVLVIGQGTAAVAGQSLAAALRDAVRGLPVTVEAIAATELSGFGLRDDMSDTLVVAISQSGTTTDTNRTVDLVRARGAALLAIVNRRQSDLVDKSDGVLFTSDGRDVEMSVASTKAFYAQIAAGFLLAFAIAAELGAQESSHVEHRNAVLGALRQVPDALVAMLERRAPIAAAAQRHGPQRRSWAVVGNGVNRIAASEVRIKLSELCYKSIACDVTEDKKHIDLSAEPLILVCAAGLRGSNADDVGKELAIYRAHKAAAIAIVDDGESRLGAAVETISVPSVHPAVAFVLSTMAGHLFGYEAALAIDASARPLRQARAHIEALIASNSTRAAETNAHDLLSPLARELEPCAGQFFAGLRGGGYDGALEARTAVRLASLLRFATGVVPLDAYQVEFGKVGTPGTLIDDLTDALTVAIDELTRPVDAIKHQAKTVTVGISRSDETLLRVRLVADALAAGAPRDRLSYRALRTLVALDASVDAVVGFTRYRIEGDVQDGATIHVVDRGGVAREIPSRTVQSPVLRGTKHRAATEREVTVVRGRSDGRTLILVPEAKDGQTTGLTLLHVRFHERLPADVARRVLQGYRDRYAAIRDQVTETEPTMRDEVLGQLDLVELLTEPVVRLADHWRA